MSDLFQEPPDATPLESAEREGLLQSWITNRKDLNNAEQDNIIKGATWAKRSRRAKPIDLLTTNFALSLHRNMFGGVWAWAGQYRTTARNIGIEAWRIPTEVAALFDDVSFWLAHQTYSNDELTVKLHHRLVSIHPFPNGNGRHARLLADLLIERLGSQPFTWGGGTLHDAGDLRANYIAALRAADNHDIGPLLVFARG